MELNEFAKLHPQITGYRYYPLSDIDFQKLHERIERSQKYLAQKTLFGFFRKNYAAILAGKYDDAPATGGTHFKNERTYTREQLENLYDDPDTIEL